jgi:phosphatidylglycerol:prolipoprotein diacylglycerol transferase
LENLIVGPWPVIQIGSLILPTYYIVISAVLTITTLYVYKRAERLQYSGTTAMDLYLTALICGALGARLMHVFYEAPDYYWQYPWEVFYFWQGGFVYYGGVIAGFIAGMTALKIKRQSFALWLDFFTPVISIGYALGRLACFFAGCCYGKVCDLPWAFPFSSVNLATGATSTVYLHPTQLYATGLELILFSAVLYIDKKKLFKQPGQLFTFWIFFHALSRILIEAFRADDRGPLMDDYSISTRISVLIIVGVLFIYRNQRRYRKVP